jgi:VanZ family protein
VPTAPTTRDIVARWLLVVSWATLISILSTGWFAGEYTGSIVIRVLTTLFPHATLATLAAAHQGLRKMAHFAEYFVLGVLLYQALRPAPGWSLRTAVLAVAIAGAYSVADEVHQLAAPGRVGSLADCLIDIAGAMAAQGLVAARRRAPLATVRVESAS